MIVVEHDREVIEHSDAICDFGPKAGNGGGEIVASGTPAELVKCRGSVTGPYLNGKKSIPIPSNRRPALPIEPLKGKGAEEKAKPKQKAIKKSEATKTTAKKSAAAGQHARYCGCPPQQPERYRRQNSP